MHDPSSVSLPKANVRSSGACFKIDLNAVAHNFWTLQGLSITSECAAVVKGDGYGHGMIACSRVLQGAGARTFFVATIDDAIALRAELPSARIVVLGGLLPSHVEEFLVFDIVPVLNSRGQLLLWISIAKKLGKKLRSILHFDTGMNRLGLRKADAIWLAEKPDMLRPLQMITYMTHLSSADDLDLDRCEWQLQSFAEAVSRLPPAPHSIANSSASYFGARYRADLFRPGKSVFGINPLTGRPNPVVPPARVTAPILQVESIRRGEPVGYSSTFRPHDTVRIATVGIGYVHGYPRLASNRAMMSIAGIESPVVGRVSMDVVTLDVSLVPERFLTLGAEVEVIGPNQTVEVLAKQCGTIEHEILIALGRGCQRDYIALDQNDSIQSCADQQRLLAAVN